MKTSILFGIAIVAIVGAVVVLQNNQAPTVAPAASTETDVAALETVSQTETMDTEPMEADTETPMETDTMNDTGSPASSNETTTAQSGTYTAYTETALAMSDTEHTVVFFHADWCPTCRATDAALQAELDAIPSNLTILKADYDTETDLRAEYGVTLQHSFALINSDGELVRTWNGSSDLGDIVAQL